MVSDPRLAPCENCQGEGRLYVRAWGYEPGCGHAHNYFEDDRGECPVCDGTGEAIIETDPVDLEDLDELSPPDDAWRPWG